MYCMSCDIWVEKIASQEEEAATQQPMEVDNPLHEIGVSVQSSEVQIEEPNQGPQEGSDFLDRDPIDLEH